ncbi:MMPL family transporter [Actinoallomurus iriomotensis]|uniref:Membrane protein n=1 Tax=Actinoallomurus iriomotensis TaxID=478107 RepID=A0A9W6RWT3_9ACTN|nr:MMPL family transporter [Actinoallomurus iriomotensis]GLY81557.1 membrane protein [Actinoallomurus iriomotensis]
MKPNMAARLGGWSARHRKTAIFGWLLFVVAAVLIGGMVGQQSLTDGEDGVGDSGRAQRIVSDAGITKPASEMVLVHSATVNGFRAALPDVTRAVRSSGQATAPREPLVSRDGHDALVQFDMTGDPKTAGDRVAPVQNAVAAVRARHPEVRIEQFGDASGDHWFDQTLGKDFSRAELTAVPLALGILLVAFAALLAAVVPVVIAVTAFLAANGLLAVVSHGLHMDGSASSVMLLMGLAVGVDYCLFYLRREREERAAGRDRETALRIAAATSGRSVLVSGLTVMVAMAGMFFSGMLLFDGFAVATILVVLIAVLGSVTVLPALLSLLGDKVEFGRVPFLRRRRSTGRFWDAVLRPVLRRPGISAVLAAGVLLVLAAPALGMHTEKLGIEQQVPRDTPLMQTYDHITAAFPGGPDPATVVLKAKDIEAPAVKSAIASFESSVRGNAEFGQSVRTRVYAGPDVAIVDVPLAGSGSDATSQHALKTLRAMVPRAFDRVAEAHVAGTLAFSDDWNDQLRGSIVPVFVFVLGVTFLLMLVSFRSLPIAATAIVLNLLSVGAAYGVMVAVFQHGWGASLVGTHGVGAIEAWLPLFVFVVLFGLSMDYHVFVVSRIREAHDRGVPTSRAVAEGIRSTAGAVTSAATIMVAVFAVFGTLSMQDFKQMGVGLAVAVLLDATVVRAVLLPSAMRLLGERNWYLPRWLGWLPDLSHGEEPAPSLPPEPVPV